MAKLLENINLFEKTSHFSLVIVNNQQYICIGKMLEIALLNEI